MDDGATIIPFKQRPTPELIVEKIDILRRLIATENVRPPVSIHRPTELEIKIAYHDNGYVLRIYVDSKPLREQTTAILQRRGDIARESTLEPAILASYRYE
jgi:hypothetical protein